MTRQLPKSSAPAEETVPERRDPPGRRRLRRILFTIGSIIVFVMLWEVVLRILKIQSFLVPRPAEVLDALMTSLERRPTGRGSLIGASWSTYSAALMAFANATGLGFVVALALARWGWLERTVKPYIVAFQTLPRIAIAPLFLIWFGQGLMSKVLLATLVAFFPVMVNTLAGLKTAPPEWLEWMRIHGASSWQIFRHVKLWSALPFIFAGLEVALVFSILGVVVTEFVGAADGLGVLILQSHYAADVAGVFSVFVFLVTFGLLLRLALMALRARLLFWAELGETGETGP